MNEINKKLDNKTCLGNHCWLLGTDAWQLAISKVEVIKKLLPKNDKLDRIIQIAQILDRYQKEIDYYQSRIRGIVEELEKRNKN